MRYIIIGIIGVAIAAMSFGAASWVMDGGRSSPTRLVDIAFDAETLRLIAEARGVVKLDVTTLPQ